MSYNFAKGAQKNWAKYVQIRISQKNFTFVSTLVKKCFMDLFHQSLRFKNLLFIINTFLDGSEILKVKFLKSGKFPIHTYRHLYIC